MTKNIKNESVFEYNNRRTKELIKDVKRDIKNKKKDSKLTDLISKVRKNEEEILKKNVPVLFLDRLLKPMFVTTFVITLIIFIVLLILTQEKTLLNKGLRVGVFLTATFLMYRYLTDKYKLRFNKSLTLEDSLEVEKYTERSLNLKRKESFGNVEIKGCLIKDPSGKLKKFNTHELRAFLFVLFVNEFNLTEKDIQLAYLEKDKMWKELEKIYRRLEYRESFLKHNSRLFYSINGEATHIFETDYFKRWINRIYGFEIVELFYYKEWEEKNFINSHEMYDFQILEDIEKAISMNHKLEIKRQNASNYELTYNSIGKEYAELYDAYIETMNTLDPLNYPLLIKEMDSSIDYLENRLDFLSQGKEDWTNGIINHEDLLHSEMKVHGILDDMKRLSGILKEQTI